jgi:hypothetical protein
MAHIYIEKKWSWKSESERERAQDRAGEGGGEREREKERKRERGREGERDLLHDSLMQHDLRLDAILAAGGSRERVGRHGEAKIGGGQWRIRGQ